jgi:rRNA maturation endonuclease Nob1
MSNRLDRITMMVDQLRETRQQVEEVSTIVDEYLDMMSAKDTEIAKLRIALEVEEDNVVASDDYDIFLENRLRAHTADLVIHNSATLIRIEQKLDEINNVLRRH